MREDSLYYETGPYLPADNDHLLPPQYFLDRELAREDLDVVCVKRGDGFPTVITFGGSGLNPETGLAMYSMQNFLKESMVNQIYLRDQFTCWFHNGVRGASLDVASTATYLRTLLREWGAEQVLCTGASAGGYSAILFGVLLNATGIVALNPQTLLKRGVKCQAHGYLYLLKWADGEGTWEATKQQYADLLDLPPSPVRIEIVYGTDDFVDVFHAERMGVWPNVRLEPSPGTHGTTIYKARDTGLLAQLFAEVLAMPVWVEGA